MQKSDLPTFKLNAKAFLVCFHMAKHIFFLDQKGVTEIAMIDIKKKSRAQNASQQNLTT